MLHGRVIEQIGPGTVILSGDNTPLFGIEAIGGTIQMGSTTGVDAAPIIVGPAGIIDLHGFNITASSLNAAATATNGIITNNAPSGAATLTVTGGGTYNGIITNGAGATTALVSTGGTLILANMNSTYTGGTNITGGTVQAGNGVTPTTGFSPFADNALGTGPVVISNATLNLDPMAATATVGVLNPALIFNYSNAVTMAGGATLRSSNGFNVISGAVAINNAGNTLTVQYPTMPLEFTGQLSGAGSVTISGVANTYPPKNVEFFGDGTNYTGTMTLNASAAQILLGSGTALLNANLIINGNNAASNDTVDVMFPYSVGSALVFASTGGGFSTTVGSINSSHAGDGNINLVTLDGVFGANLGIGNNNQNSNLSGIISDTPTYVGATSLTGGITKVGAGSLVLSGANTYTGQTTINAGTLVAGVNGALPAGAVSVTGGTLQLAPGTGLATLTSLSVTGSGVFDGSVRAITITQCEMQGPNGAAYWIGITNDQTGAAGGYTQTGGPCYWEGTRLDPNRAP